MKCLNINIPAVQKELENLTNIFNNDKIAYSLLSLNNGYSLDKTPKGDPSALYKNILKNKKVDNNELKAHYLKARAYTNQFRNIYTDWIILEKEEPNLNDLLAFEQVKKISPYSNKDTVFIGIEESAKNFDKRLTQTKQAIKQALNQGVTSFVTKLFKVEYTKKGELEIRNFLLGQNLVYIEKDNSGFYMKKAQDISKNNFNSNIIKVNNTTINLKQIGIDFNLNKGQKEAVQDFADWIDGKSITKISNKTYDTVPKNVLKVGNSYSKGFKMKGKDQTYGLTYDSTSRQQIINLYNLATRYPQVDFYIEETNNKLVDIFSIVSAIPENIVFEKNFHKLVSQRLLEHPTKNFSLIGNAGTGKTSITNIFIEYMNKNKKHVIASAMTHRAVNVMKSFFKDKVETTTFHKAIGLQGDILLDTFNTRQVNFVKTTNALVNKGSIFIIDEASMMNNALYEMLKRFQERIGYKVLFIGDDKQFKPVKQKTISKVFNIEDKYVKRLTQVERQNNKNSLLETLSKFRIKQPSNKTPLGNSRTSSIDSNNEGIEWTNSNLFMDSVKEVFTSDKFKNNPYYSKIVAYKNETVSKYNKKVRTLLGFDQELELGEVMMGYDTYSEIGKNSIMNGADYTVANKTDTSTEFTHPNIDTNVTLKGTQVELIDKETETKFSKFIVSRYNETKDFNKLASLIKQSMELYQKQYKLARDTGNYNYRKKANKLYSIYKKLSHSFLLLDDLTLDNDYDYKNNLNVLKRKSIDYGYAITAHKSQGGTYDYILVDETDIDSMYNIDIEATNQAKYVAFSRASKGVIAKTNASITNNESFNFSLKSKLETENIALDIDSKIIETLIKDNIINKTCK